MVYGCTTYQAADYNVAFTSQMLEGASGASKELPEQLRGTALHALEWLKKREPDTERESRSANDAARAEGGAAVLDVIETAIDGEIAEVHRSLSFARSISNESYRTPLRPTHPGSAAAYSTAHLQEWLDRTPATALQSPRAANRFPACASLCILHCERCSNLLHLQRRSCSGRERDRGGCGRQRGSGGACAAGRAHARAGSNQ